MANTRPTRLSCILVLIFCTNFHPSTEQCEGDDHYVIRCRGTELFLDATDPKQVRMQHFTGTGAQLWKFKSVGKPGLYYIVNKQHDKVLDFNTLDDGLLHLAVNELQKSMQQKWNFNHKGNIANAANGKNVDIHNENYNAGAQLVVWEDNGCSCQVFHAYKKG